MNDEPNAQFLVRWLSETEVRPPDPQEGTRWVMSRSSQTRQVRCWWPVAAPKYVSRGVVNPLLAATKVVAATAALALFGGVLLVGGLWPQRGALQPSAPGAPGDEGQPAIHWRSAVVDLRADSMTLEVGDETFTTEGVDVVVDSADGNLNYWALYPRWVEDGVNHWLYLEFSSDGKQWRMSHAELWRDWLVRPDGAEYPAGPIPAEFADLDWLTGVAEFIDPAMRLPLGEPYVGDLTLEGITVVPTCESVTPEFVDVTLTFENLRLSVSPRQPTFIDEFVDDWLRKGTMLGDIFRGRLEPPTDRVLECPDVAQALQTRHAAVAN